MLKTNNIRVTWEADFSSTVERCVKGLSTATYENHDVISKDKRQYFNIAP